MKKLISFSGLKKDCKHRDYGWCNGRFRHCQLCIAHRCPIWKKLDDGKFKRNVKVAKEVER